MLNFGSPRVFNTPNGVLIGPFSEAAAWKLLSQILGEKCEDIPEKEDAHRCSYVCIEPDDHVSIIWVRSEDDIYEPWDEFPTWLRQKQPNASVHANDCFHFEGEAR